MSAGQTGKTAFLVGAGRSGTTLLYKILCLHPEIAYITNYEHRLPWLPAGLVSRIAGNKIDAKLFAWFNDSGKAYFIKRPLIKKLYPTPIEGEIVYQKCGIPLFPPTGFQPNSACINCLRNKFSQIRRSMKAKVMLSKRTANNRRIDILKSIFPQARYIHLIRDGREVADSLTKVEWWDDHIIWWDGRTAAEMEKAGEQRLVIAAKNWAHEMQELQAKLAAIPAEQVLDVRFERLLTNPLEEVRRILEFLGLTINSEFQNAIESLRLNYRPGTWESKWTPDQTAIVLDEIRSLLIKFGYLNNTGQGEM